MAASRRSNSIISMGQTTIVRAAYNMAEAVVWLHEQCTRVPVCACARGRQVHVCCRPARRCCRPSATVLSAGGTVLSAECGIGGERLVGQSIYAKLWLNPPQIATEAFSSDLLPERCPE